MPIDPFVLSSSISVWYMDICKYICGMCFWYITILYTYIYIYIYIHMFRFPWGIPMIEKFPNQFPFDWTTKVWIAILEARPVRMGRKGCCDVWGAIGFPAKAWLHEVHASWSILLGRVAQTTNEHGGPSRIAAADHTFTRRSRRDSIRKPNLPVALPAQHSWAGTYLCEIPRLYASWLRPIWGYSDIPVVETLQIMGGPTRLQSLGRWPC